MSQPFTRHLEFHPSRSVETPDCFLVPAGPNAPTLVAIHGISRNAAEMATRFAALPQMRDVNIIAPLFERKRFGKYQSLQSGPNNPVPSHLALFALLEELRLRRGIATDKFYLFGFSGGAQMAHRLAMFYPSRVHALCAASAGWYLLPDPDLPYPYGIGPGRPAAFDAPAFFAIPTTVVIGTRDIRIDSSVRQDGEIISRQGRTRLERGRIWVQLMNQRSAALGGNRDIALVELKNGSHDFGLCVREAGLLEHVAAALVSPAGPNPEIYAMQEGQKAQ